MNTFGFETRSLYDNPDKRTTREASLRKDTDETVSREYAADNYHPGRTKRLRVVLAAAAGRMLLMLAGGGWRKTLVKMIAVLTVAGLSAILLLWFTLPDINDPGALYASQSTVIVDRNGTELYRLYSEQDRTPVASDKISNFAKQATIAIEDERFFERGCVDVIGFSRAVLSQLLPGVLVRSGGSTLTQQFAGNALVGRRRSVVRKMRELMLACQLERRYDKDELLVLYLNRIPYGHNAYGIEQAARNYFGVSAADISLAQAAVLAALPQRPSYFSPYGKNVRTQLSASAVSAIMEGKITESSRIPDSEVTIGLLGQTFGSGAMSVYVGGRTDQVLMNMLKQRMISTQQFNEAMAAAKTMPFTSRRQTIRAPHFVLSVHKQIQELLNIDEELLERGGFRVTTTLDWDLQQIAQRAVISHSGDLLKRFGAHNASLLAVSPETREVLAYVGNIDYSDEEHEGKIDMVRSPRQPGSSFKPFVYAAAFEQGYGPASVVYDVPTKFGPDQPQNYDGGFWGLMSMRTALGASRNIPAIKAFFLAGGEEAVLGMASKLGVVTPGIRRIASKQANPAFEYGYPLAIGAAEAPLSEMVEGYATLADGGKTRPLATILKITDKDGAVRYLHKPEKPAQVIDPRIAAQVSSVLSDTSTRPNEYWQTVLSVPGFQTAAKTGTSNKCLEKDDKQVCKVRRPESTWTIGYTPNIVAGVWVGNATSQSLFEKADGLTPAAPIWHEFMIGAHKKLAAPVTAFPIPSNLVQPLISRLSGQLASQCTPVEMRRSDIFLQERIPSESDPACIRLIVDKVTGLLGSPACPEDAAEEQSFFIPTSELPVRWPQWEQGVSEWTQRQMEIWKATEDHSGSLLPLPLAPTEKCDPSLTPGRLEKPVVTFVSPAPGENVPYPAFQPRVRIESKAEIREVAYAMDKKPIGSFTQAPFSGPVRIPRSIDTEGTHTLSVTVTDEYFNVVTAEINVRLEKDRDPPRISFISPTDGTALTSGGNLVVSVDVTDAGGVDRVQFYLGEKLLTTRRSEPYQVEYRLDEPPGIYTLRAVARDSAGNESEAGIEIRISY